MGLDLWFQADVARILAATQETMATTMDAAPALDPAHAAAYRQGFTDALHAVGVAFGLADPMLPAGRLTPGVQMARDGGVTVVAQASRRERRW